MATLTPFTVGDLADPSSEWDSATNGDLGDDSDLTFGHYGSGNPGGATIADQGWEGNAIDSDLGSMDTLFCVLRKAVDATNADVTFALRCRIMDGATVLAASESGGTMQNIENNIANTSPENTSSVEFVYVNTGAAKSSWDAMVVEVSVRRVRSKGGGTNRLEIYEADFTGTYTVAVASTFLPNIMIY